MNEINQLFIRSNIRSLNGVATCADLQEGGGGPDPPGVWKVIEFTGWKINRVLPSHPPPHGNCGPGLDKNEH